MIGTHTVTVSPAAPTAPINLNPYMTNSAQYWQSGGFEIAIGWAAGQVTQSRGGGLFPAQTAPVIPRLAGDNTYRVRARLTKGTAGWVRIGIHVGLTADDVSLGPFWRPAGSASMTLDFGWVAAGTTAVYDADFVVPASWAPTFPYIGGWVATDYVAAGGPVQTVDSVELLALPGSVADLTCHVDTVAINHGRADTTSQPSASSATLDISTEADSSALATLDVGNRVDVTTTIPGYPPVYRFTGRITDVNLGWDDAGEDTPAAGVVQVTAVGTMADLGRRIVGTAPFPQEDDGDRVARVAELAAMPLDPTVSDPGTVQILPRDIDSQPALGVMQATAISAGGLVWQTKDGALTYSDSGHRHNVPVALELDACDVLVTPTWVRNLDGLTNDVSVGYGLASGSDQPRYLKTDPNSITRWGRYAVALATELAALADAQAMGNLLILRNSQPTWILSALPVDVEALSALDTHALLDLDLNALIRLIGLPIIGSAPTEMYAWVEGWRETLTFDTHDLELVVSDYCRTAVPVVWNDPYATKWNDVTPTRTWDQGTCWGGPIPGIGRWDDTATALRWDQVAPATTWDTWAGV